MTIQTYECHSNDLYSSISCCRLIVLLQDKTFIYDIDSLAILSTIDTVPNPKGVFLSRICVTIKSKF